MWEQKNPCVSEHHSGPARNAEAPVTPPQTNVESVDLETVPQEKFDRTAYQKKYMKMYMKEYRKRAKARRSSPDGTST